MRNYCLALIASFAVLLRAAEPVTISEFMAANSSVLADEDGLYPDWIELRNTGTSAVNLDGWFLTDNAANLMKWRLPATNINPGAFIIVFADGKDRKVPGAPLHANFSLSTGGEYLALVKTNGVTKASEFAPVYGPQTLNVSYGFGAVSSNFTAITTNAAVRVQIPSSGADGTNWMIFGYDDTAWIAGTNGVGYGTTNAFVADYAAAIAPTAPVVHYRFNETSGTVATNIGSLGAANGTYTSVTLGNAGPRPPGQAGFESGNNGATFNGSSSFVAGPNGFFNNRNAFTVGGWVNLAATPGSRIGLFGQNDCIEFGFSSGTTIELWTPGGGAMQTPYPHPLNTWHHIVGVGDGTALRVYIDGVQAGTGGAATANYGSSAFNFNIGGGGIADASGNFFNGQIDEVVAYHRALSAAEVLSLYRAGTNGAGLAAVNFVRTDVGAAMSNVNASAYIRIPFEVPNPTNISGVTLHVQHDDGFIAYINGIEVARVNAGGTPAFNSAATNTHAPTVVDQFVLGASFLQAGTNMLAIQGLNLSAADEDFLVRAELITTTTSGESTTPLYFTVPTPGAANGSGVANPGPAILSPAHTPLVPLDHQDLVVTAQVVQTFFPVSSVALRYKIMFGAEIEVPMFDDGLHGDGGTNDGVFGATIPASASTNGQMIRYYIRATDGANNVSRWPLFLNPLDGPEFLGTVVNPTNLTSKLPIFHLFAPTTVLQPGPVTSQIGADSEAGGRVAIFYDGEFYDNVYMELRGNTSATLNKKAHRVEFNRGYEFRHPGPGGRVRRTSFLGEYLDPAYLRQHLSFWFLSQIGVRAPFDYPVRLQLNGEFYQLAFHNDVIGREQVERMGYDPNGALYKAVGVFKPDFFSTGGFQKMEPENDPSRTDYLALANGINEASSVAVRRSTVFDLLDVPQVINHLAGTRWCSENDDVWANMAMYRDTFGDGLWRNIPFDMNASWGQLYGGSNPLQATNDASKSHPLYGGVAIIPGGNPAAPNYYNRLYDVVSALPELRQMILRRQRSIMDQMIQPPGTPTNALILENYIKYMTNQISVEANLDRTKWGFSPWAAGKTFNDGVGDLLNQFVGPRRQHWYVTHSITNTSRPLGLASTDNAGIPLLQPTNISLAVIGVEFNPANSNQQQEYICLSNASPIAVDLTGWQLDGAVEFTFAPGTVVPSNSVVYVSPNTPAFRARTTGPRGGQGLFVVGPYSGQLSARGETVLVKNTGGQTVSSLAYVGAPTLLQQYLRISEIMYHPAPGGPGSPFPQEEFEYLELKNIGPTNLNLVGLSFSNGIAFAFTPASAVTNLAPGQAVVLVKNPAAFVSRYGIGTTIAGTFTGTLDNNGERLRLVDPVGEEVHDFSYNNSWHPLTDGLGFSLVVADENQAIGLWDARGGWRASGVMQGSPGTNDPVPGVFAAVLVNEVLAGSELPAVDAIELWNNSTNVADVSDWWISDDFFTPRKFRIPAATTIPPGGFLVFTEADFNVGGTNFAFGTGGDEAYVFSGNAAGELTGYYHGFDFGASEPGVTFGRYVPSDGGEHFVAQAVATLNATNSAPKVGPLVISEIMYHPPDINTNGVPQDDELNEFIELHNISGLEVPLFDLAAPTNRWKLTDAVDFVFPTNTVPAGGFLVVVGFDPETNATALAAFRARYGLDTNVAIVGPWSGQLNNEEDSVKLRKPQVSGTNIHHVLVEEVHYHDAAPWDGAADGLGAALHRIIVGDYGNDPTNFVAATPGPGSAFVGGTPPAITQQPADATVFVAGSAIGSPSYLTGTTNFVVGVNGTNLTAQWRFNGVPIPGATNLTLVLTNIQFSQAGAYSLFAYNNSGSLVSSSATLTVISPVTLTFQPTNVAVLPGTNVTLTVAATSSSPLAYQWRFEGADIPGATNASYSFTNANLNQHHGNFSAVVTDAYGSLATSNAFVYVLVKPGVVQHIAPQSVPFGGNATVTCLATGAPPITYRFFRGSTVYAVNTNGVAVYSNITATTGIKVVITNLASSTVYSPGPGSLNTVNLTVAACTDCDGDGMLDSWEIAYLGGTNASPTLDSDGDGMNNRDEFRSGTIPTNALSVLKMIFSTTNASELVFVAQTNLSYSVQWRTNLVSPTWTNLTSILASPQVRTISVDSATAPAAGERYFRVVTPMVP